jgi:predicted ATPase
MLLRVIAENYRGLAQADWTLTTGVSLLVGPNGSGKTTLLDVPALLGDAIAKGMRSAIDDHGGPTTIVNLKAVKAQYARVGASVESCSWELELRPQGGELTVGHRIVRGEQQTLRGARLDSEAATPREPQLPEPLVRSLRDYRFHDGYRVRSLRTNGSRLSSGGRLDPDGANAFSVLRNWRDARSTQPRWDFVVSGLKEAFPGSFEEIEFESAGQTLAARFFAPRAKTSTDACSAPAVTSSRRRRRR